MDTASMEILLNLQKKFNKVNELQDVTKQMAECLQRNDIFSFELLMDMRADVMLELDSIEYAQEDMLQGLSEMEEKQVRKALTLGVDESQLKTVDLRRIHEIYGKIKRSLENTIQFDKAISLKMGRETSFYKN